MTVMSMFNNCRVFREDMPDNDIEDAAVDFTNMVSHPYTSRISEDIFCHISSPRILNLSQIPDSISFKLQVI